MQRLLKCSSRQIYRRNFLNLIQLKRLYNTEVSELDKMMTIPITPMNGRNQIIMTHNCAQRIKFLNEKKGELDRKLRVLVDSGGCSGLSLQFSLDKEVKEDDYVFEREGSQVVIDTISFDFIEGATVDYVEEMASRSFKITRNPQAQQTCSCGSSFDVKNEVKDKMM